MAKKRIEADGDQYGADQIKVLKGLEAVRIRPAMYIGGTDTRGLHHIVWEAVHNSVDEHLAGHCKNIYVTLMSDGGLSVQDDGRGIPVSEHPTEKKSALEVVMTTLHAGGKFEGGGYRISGGLHGVGISCTNALSSRMIAKVWRDGHEWSQEYERGVPRADVAQGKKTSRTGTEVTFWPDPTVFPKTQFNLDTIVNKMRETAFLCPTLTIVVEDEASGEVTELHFAGGLRAYVEYLNDEYSLAFPKTPVLFQRVVNDITIEVALQYADQNGDTIVSFVNTINTVDHGNHVTGFRTGMTRAVNAWAREAGVLKPKDANLQGDDIRDGMTAVVAIKMHDPQFEGQTKAKLGNPEVESAVSQATYEALYEFMFDNPTVGRYIVERAQRTRDARVAAAKVAEAIKRKSPFSSNRMPEKLTDCSHRGNPLDCELYIVEGDSAAGGAKDVRNPTTQAILSLRGKPLNIEKTSLAKSLENKEIQAILTALGTGIFDGDVDSDAEESDTFDLSKLRYGKVIILADADPDGSHIQTLLLTIFFRYMRPLIEGGHLYIALPPLFGVRVGDDVTYAQDEAELKEVTAKLKSRKYSITRFKGLGEMKPKDLDRVAIDPETRRIARVEVENVGETSRLVAALMGDKVGLRKEYLVKHAAEAYATLFEEGMI